jgi:hypothetical protein
MSAGRSAAGEEYERVGAERATAHSAETTHILESMMMEIGTVVVY